MKQLYIVAAAGSGKRMGVNKPKQFLEFGGEPIFIKSLKIIDNCRSVDAIVVVTRKEYIELVKSYIEKFQIKKVLNVIEGGAERQDSIFNAIKSIGDIEDYIIGVQDGVRPFIKEEYIDKPYENLIKYDEYDGYIIGVKVKDTIKIINGSKIEKTPLRDTLIAAQTPQVFKGKILKKAYEEAEKNGFVGTDDASLVENIGGKVGFLEGSYENIKITTVEDLLHLDKRG